MGPLAYRQTKATRVFALSSDTMLDMTNKHVDISIPRYAQSAIDALEAEGFESWLVGGCVRDSLLGRSVNDYDIATAAPWQDTERVLSNDGFGVHRTGVAHGTVTASMDGHALEITTFRTEGSYSDGRHPDSVQFTRSIREDLARRDFTINALAYHPQRGLLDCWNGIDDLDAGLIRTVGDPGRRFKEDGLRILRGCRFASQLGFSLEAETLQAMKAHKMMLLNTSAERVTHELDGLLLGEHVHDALMATVDVLVAVLPEVAACRGFSQNTPYHIYDVWEHTAWTVQRTPCTRVCRWAALLHDIGKPSAGFMEGERMHFYGHPRISTQLAEGALQRLAFSPAFVKDVLTLVRLHDVQIEATPKAVKRALGKMDGDVALFRELIGLKRADAASQSELGKQRLDLACELEAVLDRIIADDDAFSVKQLAINGRDVMEAGVAKGPLVGRALNACLDEVIEERLPNERGALLDFVRSLPQAQ